VQQPTEITPSEIPTPVLEAGWQDDAASSFEEENWDNLDKLSRQKKQNELVFHKAVGWCIPIAIGIAFIGLAVSTIIYLVHVLAPDSWRWLTADEVDRIHNMLFSGAVGAGLAETVRYYARRERSRR
jgi:hypothetical protein